MRAAASTQPLDCAVRRICSLNNKLALVRNPKVKFRNPLPLLIRAACGGAIVGFIMLVVSIVRYKLSLGHVPYAYLFIIPGLPLALGIGALVGALIGTSIWIVSVISGRAFGIVGRALIGVVSALVIVTVYDIVHTEEPGYYHPTYSWVEQAVFWLLTGVILGLLPGIMARDKSPKLISAAQK